MESKRIYDPTSQPHVTDLADIPPIYRHLYRKVSEHSYELANDDPKVREWIRIEGKKQHRECRAKKLNELKSRLAKIPTVHGNGWMLELLAEEAKAWVNDFAKGFGADETQSAELTALVGEIESGISMCGLFIEGNEQ
jgi:hypothetical protein